MSAEMIDILAALILTVFIRVLLDNHTDNK